MFYNQQFSAGLAATQMSGSIVAEDSGLLYQRPPPRSDNVNGNGYHVLTWFHPSRSNPSLALPQYSSRVPFAYGTTEGHIPLDTNFRTHVQDQALKDDETSSSAKVYIVSTTVDNKDLPLNSEDDREYVSLVHAIVRTPKSDDMDVVVARNVLSGMASETLNASTNPDWGHCKHTISKLSCASCFKEADRRTFDQAQSILNGPNICSIELVQMDKDTFARSTRLSLEDKIDDCLRNLKDKDDCRCSSPQFSDTPCE